MVAQKFRLRVTILITPDGITPFDGIYIYCVPQLRLYYFAQRNLPPGFFLESPPISTELLFTVTRKPVCAGQHDITDPVHGQHIPRFRAYNLLLDLTHNASLQGGPFRFYCDFCICIVQYRPLILTLMVVFSSETFTAGIVVLNIFKTTPAFDSMPQLNCLKESERFRLLLKPDLQ